MVTRRREVAGAALESALSYRLDLLHRLSDRRSQHAYSELVDLPMSQGRALAAVGAFEPLSVNDLARHANLDKAQASRAAQALVELALVRKRSDAADARAVQLTLTAKGRRRWHRVMTLIHLRNLDLFACLTASERKLFGTLLDRLIAQARIG